MSLVLDGLNEGMRAEQQLFRFTTKQPTCVRLTQIQPWLLACC